MFEPINMEGDTITCMETTIPLDNPFDTVSIASDGFRSMIFRVVFVVKNEFFHGVFFLGSPTVIEIQ